MYDRNNNNLETITNKIKYTFDKMEGVALISYEAIQNINTNIFFKFFICITLITFHFFLLLKTIKHIKHSNYMDMQNLHKTFEREKTWHSWKNGFPLKMQLKPLKKFLLAFFVCSICSFFIRIKMFHFEIDKEIKLYQHVSLFLYIPLS